MIRATFILLLACFITGCSSPSEIEKPQAKERMQKFQKVAFAIQDPKPVMKAVLRVLQEDCYIVRHMSLDLGFLSATRENTTEHSSDKFWAGISKGERGRWEQQEITDAVVSIQPSAGRVSVRAHFQIKRVDNKGAIISIQHMQEEDFYADFFNRMKKELARQ